MSYGLWIAQADLNPHFIHRPSLHLYMLALLFRADGILRDLSAPAGAQPAFEPLLPINDLARRHCAPVRQSAGAS